MKVAFASAFILPIRLPVVSEIALEGPAPLRTNAGHGNANLPVQSCNGWPDGGQELIRDHA
jgi:hypothetical protein